MTSPLDRELRARWALGIRPGLERISAVLEVLGPPGPGLRVAVGGTNGKGSTTTFLASMLRAGGRTAGVFTSPHLVTASERINLDGRPISDELALAAMAQVRRAEDRAAVSLTGFEWITAVAAAAFQQAEPDVCILEAGLGGRLDATNALDPDLTILTAVDLDHGELLGDTVRQVAAQKAGLLRAGRPAVLGRQSTAAARALGALCDAAGPAPVTWTDPNDLPMTIELGLAGPHQRDNAAAAWAAIDSLQGLGLPPVGRGDRLRGLAAARLAGRFELRQLAGRRVLLDGAHNPHAMGRLVQAWRSRYDRRSPGALFAAKADKAAGEMLQLLALAAERVILTRLTAVPGWEPGELALQAPPELAVEIVDEPRRALAALPDAEPPALICGSFYLLGELLGG